MLFYNKCYIWHSVYRSVVFTNISPLDLLDTARAALTYRKHDGELWIFFLLIISLYSYPWFRHWTILHSEHILFLIKPFKIFGTFSTPDISCTHCIISTLTLVRTLLAWVTSRARGIQILRARRAQMRGGGEDQRTSTIFSSCDLHPDHLDNHSIDMFLIHRREHVFFWFISIVIASFEKMLVFESFLWVIIIIFLSYHPFKERPRMSYLLDCGIETVSRLLFSGQRYLLL